MGLRAFYMFKALNKNLRGRPFVINEEAKTAKRSSYLVRRIFFLNTGYDKSYDKYTNVFGDYWEKKSAYFFIFIV